MSKALKEKVSEKAVSEVKEVVKKKTKDIVVEKPEVVVPKEEVSPVDQIKTPEQAVEELAKEVTPKVKKAPVSKKKVKIDLDSLANEKTIQAIANYANVGGKDNGVLDKIVRSCIS